MWVCVGVGVGVWVCHGVSARLLGVTRRAVTVIVHDCIQVLDSPAAARLKRSCTNRLEFATRNFSGTPPGWCAPENLARRPAAPAGVRLLECWRAPGHSVTDQLLSD